MPPVFSTIRPTTINGKDHNMTLEQSIDLAEMQADMAFANCSMSFLLRTSLKGIAKLGDRGRKGAWRERLCGHLERIVVPQAEGVSPCVAV